jgi:spore germination cell wall hydrolase CwlJ-like protein
MALVMVIAAIGSIGTCTVTSALNEEQIDTTLETVVSQDVSTETTVVTSTTTPMTTTTTSTTATIESTYVVEIEVDEGLYETKVVHSGEMINWSGVTTRPFTTSTTATTTTTTTTTETTTEIPVVEDQIYVSDADYILLCNCVAHEAGATYISASEKAKVVEVIMNRVNSGSFPDSIYGVITQRGQFAGSSGYANLGCYSNQVDDLVKEGVDLYLSDPENYQHGYLYFHGDGKQNYFK